MASNNKIVVAIATCFGVGKLPYMPGTWASFFSILFLSLFILVTKNYLLVFLVLLLLFLLGTWASDEYSKHTGHHDPKEIVIDEVVGQILTIFIAVPFANIDTSNFFNLRGFLFLLVTFILFRLFDITKPWPVSFVDTNIRRGIGVMLDDVVAGLMAGLIFAAFLAIPTG
ncbi:phosphatidylglycerophosphatase A [Rickettsiales bacterium]|nr:phosphatidylglycerophosphatase A [Rickettsiales bacterium]